MTVELLIPSALAGFAEGRKALSLQLDGADAAAPTTVDAVLDQVGIELPALERRIRDERRHIRRHVNVYVDGTDIRTLDGGATEVPDGGSVQILAAVSGG